MDTWLYVTLIIALASVGGIYYYEHWKKKRDAADALAIKKEQSRMKRSASAKAAAVKRAASAKDEADKRAAMTLEQKLAAAKAAEKRELEIDPQAYLKGANGTGKTLHGD